MGTLEKDKAQLKEEVKILNRENSEKQNKRGQAGLLEVNVGGQVFPVEDLSILHKGNPSRFKQILTDAMNKHRRYFIDRNPAYLRKMLEILKPSYNINGWIKNLSKTEQGRYEIDMVMSDIKYYGVQDLCMAA